MKFSKKWFATTCALLTLTGVALGQAPVEPPPEPPLTLADAPPALNTVPVPRPTGLEDFVRDETALQVLGKSLFWDMQVGSDGKTACATCHAHAGADVRLNNTIAPSHNFANFPTFRGTNTKLTAGDFPFHKLADPLDRDSAVEFDTTENVGSAGVVTKDFGGIVDGSAVDRGFLCRFWRVPNQWGQLSTGHQPKRSDRVECRFV